MKKFPVHTWLFAIYPVLFLFSQNMQYVHYDEIFTPVLISITASGLLLLTFKFIFKSWLKAGLFTTFLFVWFYNYGLYQKSLINVVIPFYPKGIRMDHNFYKWSGLALFFLLIWKYPRSETARIRLNSLMNLMAVLLVGMTLFTITGFEMRRDRTAEITFDKKTNSSVGEISKTRPSIYYLVMDAYTREDVLNEYFGFDNSEFIDFLKSEGFYVADQAVSNYGQTVLSIPSSLNMMYLDSIVEILGEKSEDRWPMAKVLNHSKVLEILKQQEYHTMAFDASVFEIAYLNSVDEFYHTPGTSYSLFQNLLINSTAIRAFNKRKNISTLSPEDLHRKKIKNAFTMMEKATGRTDPTYVHGHVLCPHQPFLFNADGSPRKTDRNYNIWSPLGNEDENTWYKEGYTQQLQYVNSRLKELIHKIVHESKRPSVIILQGDHGSASELRNHNGFEDNDFHERFSIMNAYYFPDHDYSLLYPEISPVNSFKVVMNKYFGKQYSLEPDKSYFSDWEHPYEFRDVTNEVRRKKQVVVDQP